MWCIAECPVEWFIVLCGAVYCRVSCSVVYRGVSCSVVYRRVSCSVVYRGGSCSPSQINDARLTAETACTLETPPLLLAGGGSGGGRGAQRANTLARRNNPIGGKYFPLHWYRYYFALWINTRIPGPGRRWGMKG